MSSNSIGQIIHNKKPLTTETTVKENFKTTVPTDNCKGYQCTPKQVDLLVQDATAAGVVNPRMHAWYCKAAYKLGSEVFMRCVSQAREGKHPAKLFSYLINKALTDQAIPSLGNKKAQAAG